MIRSSLDIFVLCGQVVSVTDNFWPIPDVAPNVASATNLVEKQQRSGKCLQIEKIGFSTKTTGKSTGSTILPQSGGNLNLMRGPSSQGPCGRFRLPDPDPEQRKGVSLGTLPQKKDVSAASCSC